MTENSRSSSTPAALPTNGEYQPHLAARHHAPADQPAVDVAGRRARRPACPRWPQPSAPERARRMAGSASMARFTCRPAITKKIGTSIMPTGSIRSSRWRPRWRSTARSDALADARIGVAHRGEQSRRGSADRRSDAASTSSRIRPAANAPTIGARPMACAMYANTRHIASAITSFMPGPRSIAANSRLRCGAPSWPTITAPARKPNASSTVTPSVRCVDRALRCERRHHREDDQPEHIVDDRGAEDDLRLAPLQEPGVAEHAAGDADRRGRQRRAEEKIGGIGSDREAASARRCRCRGRTAPRRRPPRPPWRARRPCASCARRTRGRSGTAG